MNKSSEYLVWIDLEMTGLNPETDRILEIATIITDNELNIVAEGPNLAIHQTEETLALMDDWNQKQHGSSGLLQQVRNSTENDASAEEKTLEFISKYCTPKMSPLCGNSIWQDKRFLQKYMPKLCDYLHYRLIDVSTLKELSSRWYPNTPSFPKAEAHTALADIRESVAELVYLRQVFFKSSETQTLPGA